jgi:hypothetical protein
MVFHGISRAMAVARPTQDTAAAALVETLGVQPPFDSFEADLFVAFVIHHKTVIVRIF